MKTVYVFSGLGADDRFFHQLRFGEYAPIFIHWEMPHLNEHISTYAGRLLKQIAHVEPILIGLSFGGVMAIEVSKLVPVKKIILISSLKYHFELPWSIRIAARLRLHRLLPTFLLLKTHRLTYYFFGAHKENTRMLLKTVLLDTQPVFARWAIEELLAWYNKEIFAPIVQIHGEQDRLLPVRYLKPDHIVKAGGHLMVLEQAPTISKLIQQVLSETS